MKLLTAKYVLAVAYRVVNYVSSNLLLIIYTVTLNVNNAVYTSKL